MDIRNVHSILPTADAEFLDRVLDVFLQNNVDVFVDGNRLDTPALIRQAKGKLHRKGISYKVAELYVIYHALSYYLNHFAHREGNKDIAERLFYTVEENLDRFLE